MFISSKKSPAGHFVSIIGRIGKIVNPQKLSPSNSNNDDDQFHKGKFEQKKGASP